MPTIREEISIIMKDNRLVYMDTDVPYKYIYHKLIDKAKLLLKRDSDTRRVFAQTHIFLSVDRFQLEPTSSQMFGLSNFVHKPTMQQSIVEVPDAFETYAGLAMIVSTIEPSDKQFVETTFQHYNNAIRVLEYKDPRVVYYWFYNRKLVLPEVSYRAVRLQGLFVNPMLICKMNGTWTNCRSFLDHEFPCPGYLLDDIRNAVVVDILKEYLPVQPDEKPDMNEAIKR